MLKIKTYKKNNKVKVYWALGTQQGGEGAGLCHSKQLPKQNNRGNNQSGLSDETEEERDRGITMDVGQNKVSQISQTSICIRAVDPHSFYADPDPAVFLNADPDPDPDPGPGPA